MSWLDIDLEKIISDCDSFFTQQQYWHATWVKRKERKSFHNHHEQMRMNSPRGYGGEEDGKYKWGKVSSYGIFLLDC